MSVLFNIKFPNTLSISGALVPKNKQQDCNK